MDLYFQEEFDTLLLGVLEKLHILMHMEDQDIQQAQADCLKYLIAAVPDLIQVYDNITLTKNVVKIVMPDKDMSDNGTLVVERLKAMRYYSLTIPVHGTNLFWHFLLSPGH